MAMGHSLAATVHRRDRPTRHGLNDQRYKAATRDQDGNAGQTG